MSYAKVSFKNKRIFKRYNAVKNMADFGIAKTNFYSSHLFKNIHPSFKIVTHGNKLRSFIKFSEVREFIKFVVYNFHTTHKSLVG
jgi:hypothetical protein